MSGPTALVGEHPMVKVPCEHLNLSFRRTQKVAEKEAERCSAQAKALGKLAASGHPTRADAAAALKLLRKRLAALRGTLAAGRAEEQAIIDMLAERAAHLVAGENAYAAMGQG
jgi:hypothetical protein